MIFNAVQRVQRQHRAAYTVCVNARYSKSVACLVIEITTHAADCVEVKHKQIYIQEVQLSQRDSAMLRIIEFFAKSLKVV